MCISWINIVTSLETITHEHCESFGKAEEMNFVPHIYFAYYNYFYDFEV